MGAFDMTGNFSEWVADWAADVLPNWTMTTTTCPGWGGFTDDSMCLAGESTVVFGGALALVRGGTYYQQGALASSRWTLSSRTSTELR
ncbi:MAG: hypothetical protein IPJ62_09610 [Betaproteobacteria bacterium]|nr:hypothetical protein [Betaproteobacteria bacterium]